MAILRSGTEVPSHNPHPARQHAPHAPTHPDTARNIRYLRQARTYQRITGDSAATLRQKRRWLHNEHEAGRITGKVFRELSQFHSRRNISKPKNKLPKVRDLTDTAQSIKQRLDELFSDGPDANSPAGAMDESHDNTAGDAGEGPSGPANHLQHSHDSSHQALGEPTDGRVLDEPPHEGAADTVAGAYIKPEDDTETEDDTEMETEVKTEAETEMETEVETEDETEDESSSDGEDLSNRTSQARVAPTNTAEANDAAARQRILQLGLQLADRSVAGQDFQTRLDFMDEVAIKEEEEGSE